MSRVNDAMFDFSEYIYTVVFKKNTIELSLICGSTNDFMWFFELSTIYPSFHWIYVVSHYFEPQIEHYSYAYIRVLFLPCDGKRREDPFGIVYCDLNIIISSIRWKYINTDSLIES